MCDLNQTLSYAVDHFRRRYNLICTNNIYNVQLSFFVACYKSIDVFNTVISDNTNTIETLNRTITVDNKVLNVDNSCFKK